MLSIAPPTEFLKTSQSSGSMTFTSRNSCSRHSRQFKCPAGIWLSPPSKASAPASSRITPNTEIGSGRSPRASLCGSHRHFLAAACPPSFQAPSPSARLNSEDSSPPPYQVRQQSSNYGAPRRPRRDFENDARIAHLSAPTAVPIHLVTCNVPFVSNS